MKRNPDSYRRVISDEHKARLRDLHTTHGHAATRDHSHSRTYQSWMSMKERCDRPSHKSYAEYGGKGIRYCERWSDFSNFLDDMGERPAGKTLGRIKNEGHYEMTNCEWQTYKEQARNRKSNVLITFDGKTQTLQGWADLLGIASDTLGHRLAAGWTLERALTEPLRMQKNSRFSLNEKIAYG